MRRADNWRRMSRLLAITLLLAICGSCGRVEGVVEEISDRFTMDGVECSKKEKVGDFWVYTCSTPNIHEGKNQVKGIVLHHTATASTHSSLRIMADPEPLGRVSCHVIIVPDGSRYVLAPPEAITWHAGKSMLNGRNNCNRFTVGIEFQGNTLESPLTDEQIESAIDYVLPIMKKYRIPTSMIVTHQQIRDEYKKAHPRQKIPAKPDITQEEYDRFMKALHSRIAAKATASSKTGKSSKT